MRTGTLAVSAATLAGLASAVPSAIVTIEASHGGAGNGLTNTTITVPIGPVYTNPEALSAVSTLYLTGASDVDVESISCTPYKSTNGTGSHGLAFSSSTPSDLSTNTVQVGSIVCVSSNTTGGSSSNSSSSSGSSSNATTTASRPTSTGSSNHNGTTNVTSTLLTTYTPTAAPSSTSTPIGTSGATSSNVPYVVSALLVGCAGIMFTL